MFGKFLNGLLGQVLSLYAHQLWRFRWLSIGLAWIICAAGWTVVKSIPPKYESSARVYVNADRLLTPLLQGIAVDDNPARHVDFLQRTLLSRPNLEQVMRLSDIDLNSRGSVEKGDKEDQMRQLAADVSIRPQTETLLSIAYRNNNPQVAKNVVQALLTIFAENSAGTNRTEMENAKRFLNEQIQVYESQLRAAEKRRAEFRAKYLEILPGLDGTASHLEAAQVDAAKARLDLADIGSKRDSLSHELEEVPQYLTVDSAPQVVVGGNLNGTAARIDESQKKVDELLLRYTEQHPDVIAMRRQIAELKSRLAKEGPGSGEAGSGARKVQIANPLYEQVRIRLIEAESAVASQERRLKEAEAGLARLQEQARAVPELQTQSQDLDRDYAAKKASFDQLLQRREQTTISEAADTKADKIQFRIIDAPQVPVVPVAPNQPLLLSGVLIAAVGTAIGVPVLLLQLDRSFATVTNLRRLGLPVLGSISRLTFPYRQRRIRIQFAAVSASATILLAIYGLLLMISVNLYHWV
jgi:polysaccharide chain length determinant protein (PEP-CTERM system associated)